MDRAPTQQPARAPLSLRLLGASFCLLAGLGALAALGRVLTLAPPLLLSSVSSEAAREAGRNGLPSATAFLLLYLTTVFAGVGLWRASPWARAWLLCLSVAQLAILGLRLATAPPEALPEVLDAAGLGGRFGLRPSPAALYVVAAAAALYLLGYHYRALRPRIRKATWAAAASGIVIMSGLQWSAWTNGPIYRRYARAREASRLAVSPGTGRILVEPVFDGRPLDVVHDLPARIRLREIRTKLDQRVEARFQDGAVDVPGVETGIYSVSVVIDAEPSNGTGDGGGAPGDFVSREVDPPLWKVVADGEAPRHRLRVLQLIRLLEPKDTRTGLGRPAGRYRELASPVTFSWAPVPAAESYAAGVTRFRRTERGWKSEWVASDRVVGTPAWTVSLPPSGPDEHYGFELRATGAGGGVGLLEIAEPRRDWFYRFVVR